MNKDTHIDNDTAYTFSPSRPDVRVLSEQASLNEQSTVGSLVAVPDPGMTKAQA